MTTATYAHITADFTPPKSGGCVRRMPKGFIGYERRQSPAQKARAILTPVTHTR